jgi:hypothetical protein
MSTPKTEEQRERRRFTAKRWYHENKALACQTRKTYYENNKNKFYEMGKQWREENREKDREVKLESYHSNKNNIINIKKSLLKNARARATKKGIKFNITIADIYIPELCPILQIPFNRDTRRYSYSLDRKDPTKGYTKDNVWVISQIANAMKWDSTHEERVLFAKWVLSLEGGELPC